MIRKFFRKVFHRTAPSSVVVNEPALLGPAYHNITRKRFSPAALFVCDTLQDHGYDAFIVGGAVRDLLIGQPPKDFDIATNATPEQVRSVFRRARIIGRRFKIVHVMHKQETIEVTTFRGSQESETDEHGRVLRDNSFGTQAEDAARRDFTINALYYDPRSENIVDFHHGVADVKQKTLRMIGDPATRYREDPVRMLRAVRLSAKLGLEIDPSARTPIRELASLLENVPAARLFDEMLKLLFSGQALRCMEELRVQGLHHGLLPLLDIILEQPGGRDFIRLALASTDERVRADKPVSTDFLFATLLWHEVLKGWEKRLAAGEIAQPALYAAMDDTLARQARKLAITRRIESDIKEIWALQPRFERRIGRSPARLLEHPRYRAGWDLLRLRAQSGEIDMALPDWWDRYAHAHVDERESLLRELAQSGNTEAPARRKRRRKRKPAGAAADAAQNAPHDGAPDALGPAGET